MQHSRIDNSSYLLTANRMNIPQSDGLTGSFQSDEALLTTTTRTELADE